MNLSMPSRTLLALCLSCTLFAACGDDDDNDNTTPSNTSTSAQTSSSSHGGSTTTTTTTSQTNTSATAMTTDDVGTPDTGTDDVGADDIEEDTVEPDDVSEDTPPEDVMEDANEDTRPEDVSEDTNDADVTRTEWGLDERPDNPTCLAPSRPATSFDVRLETLQGGFSLPVAMTYAGEDDAWWYVVEKAGRVQRFPRDGGDITTVLDLRSRVSASANEAGLLGLAFHPDLDTEQKVYLSYNFTRSGELWSRIAAFGFNTETGIIDADSEEVLLEVEQPYSNHNGGAIRFGPDGYLYISLGDGGAGGDPLGHGQNTQTLLGTILRIDVDRAAPPRAFGIPEDNPFADGEGGAPEIFAYGLRNVWKFSFDRATGLLWAADVGQNRAEEVNVIRLGGNYGWNIKEGFACYAGSPLCETGTFVDPEIEYLHAQGRSVTGGFVYRGQEIPGLIGSYVYGDFVSGRVWALAYDEETGEPDPNVLLNTGRNVAAFAEDTAGELYMLDYQSGNVFKVVPDEAPPASTFPERLSQTGCFLEEDPTQPVAAMIPYTLNVPFWSDNAEKARWFAIPDGTTVEVDEDGDLSFPIGTVVVKEFQLEGRRVETRLFVRHEDGSWAGYSYRWNEDQTDAFLLPSGERAEIAGQTWIFPSRGECMACHTEAAGRTLGLETLQLQRSMMYPSTGRIAGQLETLDHIGIVEGLGEDLAQWTALPQPGGEASAQEHAKAYLHTNCAMCHQPEGPGRGAMDLRFRTSLSEMRVCFETPEQGDLGITGASLLFPGNPSQSILLARTNRRDALAMPPLASALVDDRGVGVLRAWIEDELCEGIDAREALCGDGADNDGDGAFDCEDSDCASDPACGAGTCGNPEVIETLPASLTGTTNDAPNAHAGTCSANTGTEKVFAFTPSVDQRLCIDTRGSSYDTFLHARSLCTDSGTELGCNDDIGGGVLQSQIEVQGREGETVYIFVDGYDGGGSFNLHVEEGTCP